MSCPRSAVSTASAAISLRGLGWPWVAACQAREDTAVALRSPFQPITCLWHFEGFLIKHGPSGALRQQKASAEIGIAPHDGDEPSSPGPVRGGSPAPSNRRKSTGRALNACMKHL